MSEQAGRSSKLRLSAVASNGRLLKGYGPLAALLVAFVLMAMLVPTKAPAAGRRARDAGGQRPRAPGRRLPAAATAGDDGGCGRRRRRGAAGGAAGGAAAAADAAARRRPPRPRPPGRRGPAPARPSRCPATPTRPRASRSRATTAAPPRPASRATPINVTYRITSDSQSFQQTLASLGGANITDTDADIERTITALATYFDNHFQFYGRKLNIEFFNGQGSITNELLGSGQQQADADAVTAAQSDARLRRAQRRDRALRRGARPAERDLLRRALPLGVVHGPVRARTCGASTPSPTTSSQATERALPQVARRRERPLRRGQPAEPAAQGGDHRPERPLVPDGRAQSAVQEARRRGTRSPTTSSTS